MRDDLKSLEPMEPVLQNRRKLLTGTAALFITPSSFANPLQRPMTPRESSIDYLAPTAYVDYEHPAIRETTQRLSQRANNKREHALAIFQFVRDEIMFGFAQGFWDNKASDVLRQGVDIAIRNRLFLLRS